MFHRLSDNGMVVNPYKFELSKTEMMLLRQEITRESIKSREDKVRGIPDHVVPYSN